MTNLFHVIKDPIHGTMQFTTTEDAWVKPFIDSPNFQRLRHIKQMGLGDYIFPGAVHSRFNHSLGCCYIASQIAHKIGLADEERQLVMIASLLHDIGHGPFSHAFEGVFHKKLIMHEDWTPYFLAEYKTDEFFSYYNRINPRYRLTEGKFKVIADMIMHKPVQKGVLADIVSSQLDADRLDYLLRDSHFCGVKYGEFDLRWMLHCLCIVQTEHGERLGITYKGIGAVEHYLMARRLMLRYISHSQKKLALEYYLVVLLAKLAESLETYTAFQPFKDTRLGKFLVAANHFNATVKQADISEIQTHKQLFLQQHYQNYKELYDFDVFSLIRKLVELKDKHPAIQLAERVQYRHMPKILRLDNYDLAVIKEEIEDFKQKNRKIYQDWQITFIQTPQRSYSGEDDPIYVINENGETIPIHNYSEIINAMSDKYEHVAFLGIDNVIAQDEKIIGLIKYLQAIPQEETTQ